MSTSHTPKPYNHVFTLAFSIDSDTEDGTDISGAQIRDELQRRLRELSENDELANAVYPPEETQYRDPDGELHTLKEMPIYSNSELDAALAVRDWMRDRTTQGAPKTNAFLTVLKHAFGEAEFRHKALPLARFCLAVHRLIPGHVRKDHAFDPDIIPTILDALPLGPDCMPAATPQNVLPQVLAALRPAPLPARSPPPSAESLRPDDDTPDTADENAPTVSNQFDVQCPRCGRDDCMEIAVTTFALLSEQGTDASGDHDWDGDSTARCVACNWTGVVAETSLEAIAAAREDAARTARIIATFVPQAWVNDYAVPAEPEGETTFDVTREILKLGREKALQLRDDQKETDQLRHARLAPLWIKHWRGPFYVNVEQQIADYYAAIDAASQSTKESQ